ncbi:MAG: aconitate hydratase AcnA [Methylacidiphilales bacterium]|nr:aconitate hydratase AcnA [Candidatus Methylacidiphilales bacterium]
MKNSYNTKTTLTVHNRAYNYFSLPKLAQQYPSINTLPFSLKILLENLLRNEDEISVMKKDIEYLAKIDFNDFQEREIAFMPARVVMQDFTGVPAVVDLASMRDAVSMLGGDPKKINPIAPVELVIDHSVMVDHHGSAQALDLNKKLEYKRNQERYEFLKWGASAFTNLKVVPPSTGIVHQVNLEFLARVVFQHTNNNQIDLYPDTVVGTDSHTTMINGLGVLGWGVGGIEAEAVMLGQQISMLIPQVIGFELSGKLSEGVTSTDLVLTIVELLRKKGVVGKFVEFYGTGLSSLSLADRATVSNMAPEYGATCGIFPIDAETIHYLTLTNRSQNDIEVIEAYTKAQQLFYDPLTSQKLMFHDTVRLDLASVVPSISGPKRPQDRITLTQAKSVIQEHLGNNKKSASVKLRSGKQCTIQDGDIVIASITSCTNTSNPSVILGAGLLAKKAVQAGLLVPPTVKTSLAPGSLTVRDYLQRASLQEYLDALGFNIVGYGCTTCIGNSGPIDEQISKVVQEEKLSVAAVLSGNRNFEGRIHPDVKMNFLASPPLVVAYALAGRSDIDFANEPIGIVNGKKVFLKDIWPTTAEINHVIESSVTKDLFQQAYRNIYDGDESWKSVATTHGSRYQWNNDSTYVQNPPYFKNMTMQPPKLPELTEVKVLAKLGDSITTDHISPAGSIKAQSPAGVFLTQHGINKEDFNSYGSRRGNHKIMMRGTFANIRLKNLIAPDTEGGVTVYHPTGEVMSIYDASVKYQESNTPLLVLAGKEYGSGSSRDWAGKGPFLLGVQVVIAISYERIHRSNLVGMGILPLQFKQGDSSESVGLSGKETFTFSQVTQGAKELTVTAVEGSQKKVFNVLVRIDTPMEWEYYKNRGILNYMVRKLTA